MKTTNITRGGAQQTNWRTGLFPIFVPWITAAINIFISSQHFLLHHSISWEFSYSCCSSYLLYRCLATTDLLVGLVSQPLTATYWMSLVHQQWNLSRYVSKVVVIASYTLCVVSLLTMTAIAWTDLSLCYCGWDTKHFALTYSKRRSARDCGFLSW